MDIDKLISIWNQETKGYCRSVRLAKRFISSTKKLPEIQEALEELSNESDWKAICQEVAYLFKSGDEFWQGRKGKQGLEWLFQRRGRGNGEYNWVYYYELAMDRLDNQTEDPFKEVK